MFTKDSNPEPTLTTPATDVAAKAAKANAPSIISADLTIKGDLKSQGDLQVDGRVEGDITAGALTIGERARVKGSLIAESVRVCGTVTGEIRADRVTLASTANVEGDVLHRTLTIEAGAALVGRLARMEKAAGVGAATAPGTTGLGYGASDPRPLGSGERP